MLSTSAAPSDWLVSRSVAAPSHGSCDHSGLAISGNGHTPLDEGVHCGGLEIKSNARVTFNAGIYVMSGDDFIIDSNSSIVDDGVAFFFTNGVRITWFDTTDDLPPHSPA